MYVFGYVRIHIYWFDFCEHSFETEAKPETWPNPTTLTSFQSICLLVYQYHFIPTSSIFSFIYVHTMIHEQDPEKLPNCLDYGDISDIEPNLQYLSLAENAAKNIQVSFILYINFVHSLTQLCYE